MQNEVQNYQKWLDNKLKELDKTKKPTLLLHACCAPCSSYCLEYLTKFFEITVLFYNPNISPKQEYDRRLNEITRFIKEAYPLNNVKLIEIGYNSEEYFSLVKGLEAEKEGGMRCGLCFRMRLDKTGEIAKEKKFDYFTTTLTISPYKNSVLLNQIGKEISQKYGVNYLFSDFKKKGGYNRSIELSKKFNLYRQDYCGCVFSKRDSILKKRNNQKIQNDAS